MRRRGFMMADAIAGLFLLAALGTLLAVAIGMQSRSANRLLDQRRANNSAIESLANLQSSGEAKASDQSATVAVERSAKFVAGKEWVEVRVTLNGRHASIVGLAPATQPEAKP